MIGSISETMIPKVTPEQQARALLNILEDMQEDKRELEKQRTATLNLLEDINEAKEEAARQRDRIQAILQTIADGVFSIDKNYRITLFNEAAAVLSGFKPEEALGKRYDHVLKFVHEESGERDDYFIREVIERGRAVKTGTSTVLIRKDGIKIAVADNAAPVKDMKGDVVGSVVVFRDVTHEREVDKAKTEFVSLASHQLRTPLSSVSWYAEMLLAGDVGKPNEKQKKYLEEIYRGNKRMIDLVNALLNVSRLELGTFAVEPELTDVLAIARSVMDELKPQIDAKNLRLREKHVDNLPKLKADPRLLRIVIQNFLSNAVKYTPAKGKVTFELALSDAKGRVSNAQNRMLTPQSSGDGGLYILIKVSDSGYGIPRAQQGKIFTKLFRADNVREQDTEGTGLGLYIAKAIVDQSGGKIWFESEEDKGTTFYVTLPLAGVEKKKGTKTLV